MRGGTRKKSTSPLLLACGPDPDRTCTDRLERAGTELTEDSGSGNSDDSVVRKDAPGKVSGPPMRKVPPLKIFCPASWVGSQPHEETSNPRKRRRLLSGLVLLLSSPSPTYGESCLSVYTPPHLRVYVHRGSSLRSLSASPCVSLSECLSVQKSLQMHARAKIAEKRRN